MSDTFAKSLRGGCGGGSSGLAFPPPLRKGGTGMVSSSNRDGKFLIM